MTHVEHFFQSMDKNGIFTLTITTRIQPTSANLKDGVAAFELVI
jgi:hypothetical protein